MIAKWIDDIGPVPLACICVIAVIALIGAVVALAQFIHRFSAELKYLNCEIRRTSGNERAHWIRRRRQLWLSLLPRIKR